jgi:hypothetical protein
VLVSCDVSDRHLDGKTLDAISQTSVIELTRSTYLFQFFLSNSVSKHLELTGSKHVTMWILHYRSMLAEREKQDMSLSSLKKLL